jgi:hypothetical protein
MWLIPARWLTDDLREVKEQISSMAEVLITEVLAQYVWISHRCMNAESMLKVEASSSWLKT